MAKSKRVVYEVICPNNPKHVFPFAFEIEPGSENVQSKVQAYCPQCDAFVQVTVKGKLPPNVEVYRWFNGP
jgi:hypothetical protein